MYIISPYVFVKSPCLALNTSQISNSSPKISNWLMTPPPVFKLETKRRFRGCQKLHKTAFRAWPLAQFGDRRNVRSSTSAILAGKAGISPKTYLEIWYSHGWFVVEPYPPEKDMRTRQLGWWHSQYIEKRKGCFNPPATWEFTGCYWNLR